MGAQLAFLDHVYAVVDAATAEAIATSGLLDRLAPLVIQSTEADGETWRARYLISRSTYIEFFGPGDLDDGGGPGASGVGLSTRSPGAIETLGARLDGVADVGRRTRETEAGEEPWFDYVDLATEESVLSIWAMEYLPGVTDRERRATLAAEFAAAGPQLGDILEVEIDTVAADLDRAEALLRAAGFAVVRRNGVVAATGGAFIGIRSVDAAEAGVRRLVFALSEPPAELQVARIGASTLTLGPDARAVWLFD